MGATTGTDSGEPGHVYRPARIEEDREPIELSEDELEKRLGSDILQAIAKVGGDSDEDLEKTGEIELELIRRAREQTGLTKEENNG